MGKTEIIKTWTLLDVWVMPDGSTKPHHRFESWGLGGVRALSALISHERGFMILGDLNFQK